MRTILIDGDIVLYEVTTVCETPIQWGDDFWTLHSDFKEACQRFDCWVSDTAKRLKAGKVIMAVSGDNNWRKDVLPTYKHNRKSKRKPLVFRELKDYCRAAYKTFEFNNLEADDVLGLLAGTPGLGRIKGEKIIVTIDKDLKTVPGLHYNPGRPEEGVVEVSLEQANYNHLLQSLTGDSVDGYSGCPGVGPVKAKRILEDPSWESVVSAYESAGLDEDDALVQARVARILRWGEYSVQKEVVSLWNPPILKEAALKG